MVHHNMIVQSNLPLIDALKQMNIAGTGALFIVDDHQKLAGIVTDGDVRRGLLKRVSLESPVAEVMNKKFHSWPSNKPRDKAILHMKHIQVRHLPVVDETNRLVDIVLIDDVEFKKYSNPIVFMVGGMGTRLHPLTQSTPKPMLTVGGRPIIEIMLERFAGQGFERFFMCTNYKSENIEGYFQSGEKWSVSIKYSREDKRLGTAGALSLLRPQLTEPLIVINGDILSNIDLTKFLTYHRENPAACTVCVAQYGVEIPYGVVEMKNKKVTRIVEKPVKQSYINTGIYLLEPRVLDRIPYNEHLDMTTLLHELIDQGETVNSFPIHEYWTDIGNIKDYEKANSDYEAMFE